MKPFIQKFKYLIARWHMQYGVLGEVINEVSKHIGKMCEEHEAEVRQRVSQ